MIRGTNGNLAGLTSCKGTAGEFSDTWLEHKFQTLGLPEKFWPGANKWYWEQRERGSNLDPDDLLTVIVETEYPKCAGCGERDHEGNMGMTCAVCGEHAHPQCLRIRRHELICTKCIYAEDCREEAMIGRSV